MKSMDVRQLELFIAVMECSSITKAAKRVSLSPGAISLQLHNLAADLRTELFVRTGKQLQPTPAAHRLAELAVSVLGQVRNITHEFQNDPAADTRPFHFATGATALIHQLGGPLRRLRRHFPNTPFKITVCATEDMAIGLLERRFDLALISLPFEDEHLSILPTFEEEMVMLKPSAKPVRTWHVGSIPPAALADASFILYARRSNVRAIIDGFFRDIGVTPRVIMEADDTEVMRRLVEAGFGYSILPEHALRGHPRFFHPLRVDGRRLTRQQALATVRSEHPRALTAAVARFLHGELTKKPSHE